MEKSCVCSVDGFVTMPTDDDEHSEVETTIQHSVVSSKLNSCFTGCTLKQIHVYDYELNHEAIVFPSQGNPTPIALVK